LYTDVTTRHSDAAWLREAHRKFGSLNDVARCQSEEWTGHALALA